MRVFVDYNARMSSQIRSRTWSLSVGPVVSGKLIKTRLDMFLNAAEHISSFNMLMLFHSHHLGLASNLRFNNNYIYSALFSGRPGEI